MELMILVPAVAVVLDLIIGDPKGLPHPVRLLGKLLDAQEGWVRKKGGDLKGIGTLLTILIVVAVFLLVLVLTSIPVVGLIAAVYLAFAGLSLGQLLKEAKGVEALIASGNLTGAREQLATLVTRDTSELDEAGLRKTLAETTSENLNDGFFAPLFYLLIGGPALMWAYKTVSTMDSMWGHRTKDYERLGWAAAKLDDILAYIPARITALFLGLAGSMSGMGVEEGFQKTREDAAKTDSPNAGWPMAAAAWLVGAPMGGPAVYHGKTVNKPVLGPAEAGSWTSKQVSSLLGLVRKAGITGAVACYVYYALMALAS